MVYYKSRFIPKNKSKYAGDINNIICRSSWERALCHLLDINGEVIRWASEEIVIPYISPVDQRSHRYFPDFVVAFSNGSKMLIEVKPYSETKPPKEPKRRTAKAVARFRKQTATYYINQAKWAAARKIAALSGASFVVFTERELRKAGAPV